MKKIWLILGLAAALGLILMAAGFVFGAVPDLTIDRDGIHIGESGRQQIQAGLDEVTGLDIESSSARIEVIPAEKAGLEIDCGNNPPVTWSQENGILKIRQGYNFFWSVISFNFGFHEDVIKIYLPETAVLDSVKIAISSGSVNVNGLNCQSLNLTAASGSLDIANVSADEFSLHCTSGKGVVTDCSAKQMRLSLTSGSVRASGIKSEGMSARATSGTMRLAGDFSGENSIDVTSGTCIMEAAGSEADYSRTVSVTSGSVTVNGKKVLGNDTNALAPHTLKIKLMSGSVRIQFQERDRGDMGVGD